MPRFPLDPIPNIFPKIRSPKHHLKRSDKGRIVSRAKSTIGKTSPALKAWRASAKQAGALKKGKFVLIKGALLARTRKIFAKKNY